MKVFEIIIQELLRYNVEYVFSVPGVNILPLLNGIENNNSINLIISSNESGAVYMADGYSRINGLGCCIGTTGPGITNMITGICGAYYDSVPLIVISSQVAETDYNKYAIQEMTGYGRTPNVIKMLDNITKEVYRVNREKLDTLNEDIERLFKKAMTGRKGPVYIEVCEDLWECEVGCALNKSKNNEMIDVVDVGSLPITLWRSINKCIREAKRPLVVLGRDKRMYGRGDY